MDIKELGLVDPETHWYYQAKILPFLSAYKKYVKDAKIIFDIGAGSGFFAKSLVKLDTNLTATCIDPNYTLEWSENNERIKFVKTAENPSANVYLFVDVLEHVVDDLALLRMYTDSAPPGAIIMISVPAFMSLWSPHDVFVGHYRRYKLKQIETLVTQSGLELLKSQYLFGSVFPIAWFVRRLKRNNSPSSDLATLPASLNWCLKTLLRLEHRTRCNKVAGISTFVVARVKNQQILVSKTKRTPVP